MSDRVAGLLLAALAIWYGLTAGTYEADFTDPLGPAAFPRMLSVPLGLLSLYLIFKPDRDPHWVRGRPLLRQIATIAVLVAYATLLEPLGFLLSTLLAVMLLGRLLGARWMPALLSGAAMSAVLFLVFDQLLDLPLPLMPRPDA